MHAKAGSTAALPSLLEAHYKSMNSLNRGYKPLGLLGLKAYHSAVSLLVYSDSMLSLNHTLLY
jgi:hypothetical protein